MFIYALIPIVLDIIIFNGCTDFSLSDLWVLEQVA